MITGAHFLFSSPNAEADRAFLRDVLELRPVDAGGGWLIFGLPPSEAAVHPAPVAFVQDQGGTELLGAVLYLMCDDLTATIAWLKTKQVECAPAGDAPWGRFTTFPLPSGGSLGLYQPRHPTAI
jgi:hypothetical protein